MINFSNDLLRLYVFIASWLIFLVIPVTVFAAQPYLEDADTTSPPAANPNSPSIDGHLWPRLMISSVQSMSGNIERYSKYNVIATQGSLINRIAELQALYPDLMYFRMVNPHEYLNYPGEDDGVGCAQSHGNPFESTTETTGNCGVYAGHWLYQPGTVTGTAITANTITIPVEDAARFDVGQYAVIYNAPAGSFNNAEHVRITGKDTTAQTLTVERGYKSTASVHDSGSIVAQHALGNGKDGDPRNWIYNLGTNAPRDGANRRYIDYLPLWMSQNYRKDRAGNTANVTVSGFVFDTEFHFEFKSKKADVNNDLVQDNGISPGGTNWWGDGFDAFHAGVRARFPDFYIIGGFRNVRGFDNLNGVQMEGYPIYGDFRELPPDYSKLGTMLSMYSMQMRHRQQGAPHTHVLNKIPTLLYPYGDSANSNAPFRFSLGMTLLEDGYYGHQNDPRHPDMWFDEYAVDVTPGSSSYGQAVPSNPSDESQVRAHRGWLGKPQGLRTRLYDDLQFAPDQSILLGGDFESGVDGWTGKSLTVSSDTSPSNVRDGTGALRAGAPGSYQLELFQAQIRSPLVNLVANTEYTLVFSTRASKLREVEVSIGGHGERFMVGPNWQRHVMPFKTGSSSNDFIRFNVGRESSQVWLDSVYVFPGNPNVFRRDFDNGIVVVNATPTSKTVNLDGTFKRILGTQDPVNNGVTLSSVTIPAYDSALLIRPDGATTTDTESPVMTIFAPTRSSNTTITDTTVVVTDDQGVLATEVEVRGDNSAGYSNLNCVQTSSVRVDCTIEITSSGILRMRVTDLAGNIGYDSMPGYLIIPDTVAPVISITAPTKNSNTTITDTTVVVTDDKSILSSDIILGSGNTAGVSNLNCLQTSPAQVFCTLEITASGDLQITATDAAGNAQDANENGYVIAPAPDTEKPVISITAPTKNSTATITDTTVEVTDNEAISAGDVILGAGNTAGVANLNCAQASPTQVDCTLDITASGDLQITATDAAGNAQDANENAYVIAPAPDTEKPVISITAPTKNSTATITDTTVEVTDNEAISASDVILGAGNTAGVANLNCVQASPTQVDCTLDITASGDLQISATDAAGNAQDANENGYVIAPAPDTEKPVISITAPTKNSTATITDTTVEVTDNEAISAGDVILGAGNTAGVANLNCVQASPTQVDCTLDITASGDLQISATDAAGNAQNADEAGYVIGPVPDTVVPVISITAPTKNSTATITDTTIEVTDNVAISASDVILGADNTAGVANLNCVQTSPTQVDCTLDITASGDLQITAIDVAGNVQDANETGYVIAPDPDTEKPVIIITAPTKNSAATITDTTIEVTDNVAISAGDVILGADNTAGVANLNCVQTSPTQVDCTLDITASGDLQISATDAAGNTQDANENGYVITLDPDTEKPVITITAPTKSSIENITDTTIQVTDNQAISVTGIELRPSNTVGVASLDCTQTSPAQVDCTIEISSSGDLKLRATDAAGNTATADEDGYVLDKLPDSEAPIVQINAPTKFSTTTITDTTIVVTDNEEILASKVLLRESNTAGVENFNCTQTSVKRVDCTLDIISSGDLKIRARDTVGNLTTVNENRYLITSTASDKTKPSLQIFAPTKISDDPITDTTILIKDNLAVLVQDIEIRSFTTAGISDFNCVQTNITRIDCTITITSSGDLKMSVTDAAGNIKYTNEDDYVINAPNAPSLNIIPFIQTLLLDD